MVLPERLSVESTSDADRTARTVSRCGRPEDGGHRVSNTAPFGTIVTLPEPFDLGIETERFR